MRILITGAAGFIGSHLSNKLIDQGHSVFGIDNLETGLGKNVDPELGYFSKRSISNIDNVLELFEIAKPDVVVHAAASYKDPENWHGDAETNVLGTVNIVKVAKQFKVKRIVYLQTSLCYGWPEVIPIPITHKIAPTNSYAISKTAAEQYIALSGIDFVSFRLANCYGERNLSGPIPTFYKLLVEGKDCTVVKGVERDFVYINDLLFYLLKAIHKGIGYGYYHVSSGRTYKIIDLYHTMSKSLGIYDKTPIFKDCGEDDIPRLLLDNSLTLEVFGQPDKFTSLKDGIDSAVKWYKVNKIRTTYTHLKGFDKEKANE